MQNNLNAKPKKESSLSGMFMNPLVRKLSKIEETSADHATYTGIAKKSGFFMLMVLAGIALCMLLSRIGSISIDMNGDFVVTSPIALVLFAVCGILFLITPFLAFFVRKTLPVTGSLYCISTGYVLGTLVGLLPEYREPAVWALVLTLLIVGAMLYLYGTGKVKVTGKFRTVVSTMVGASIGLSLIMLIFYFIPGLRNVPQAFLGNPAIYLLLSLGGIAIATMFLLVDFDTIQRTVENRLPREYEWYGAFSLVFSVVWLYFKLLDLLVSLKKGGSSD